MNDKGNYARSTIVRVSDFEKALENSKAKATASDYDIVTTKDDSDDPRFVYAQLRKTSWVVGAPVLIQAKDIRMPECKLRGGLEKAKRTFVGFTNSKITRLVNKSKKLEKAGDLEKAKEYSDKSQKMATAMVSNRLRRFNLKPDSLANISYDVTYQGSKSGYRKREKQKEREKEKKFKAEISEMQKKAKADAAQAAKDAKELVKKQKAKAKNDAIKKKTGHGTFSASVVGHGSFG